MTAGQEVHYVLNHGDGVVDPRDCKIVGSIKAGANSHWPEAREQAALQLPDVLSPIPRDQGSRFL